MNKVQKIREEVERLKRWNNNVRNSTRHMNLQEEDFNRGKHSSYLEILNFIDSLQEEPVSDELEKVVEEIVEPTILNAYGTKELAKRLRNTICGTSVSEDMNTAAKEYANNITEKIGYRLQLRRAVVYGAKWQKEQIIKRLCNHANIDKMVEKFEDKYKPKNVLDTEYYKRGIFDTIKTIKED